MYNSTNIAERIKALAKFKNIQLKTMLDDIDINKNALSNMYNGSMPKVDNLAKIADYLNCSIDYLLGRTDTLEINDLTFSENNKVLDMSNSININKNDSDEQELLKIYRCLDRKRKIKVNNFIYDEMEHMEQDGDIPKAQSFTRNN